MKIITPKQIPREFFEYKEIGEIEIVKRILKDVKKDGDKVVKKYTQKFDKILLKRFEITKNEIKQAYKQVDKKTLIALRKAAKNIRIFAQKQLAQYKDFEIKIDNNKTNNKDRNSGNYIGQKIIPLEKVGCYVPGGLYPLPSSALMSVIPAKIAGVKERIVCSPKIKPVTIVAANIAGATRIFNIGGVQAIAALAYGTETIPKVNKIVGPGNKYVAAAKKEIYGICGIDFIAGPSEVMVIADKSGNPKYIAADLLAQLEHDIDASACLITDSRKLAAEVNKELTKQLNMLKTKEIAKQSIRNSMIILVKNINQAIEIANKKAPEHLELQIKNRKNAKKKSSKLRNYGSLFQGKYSAEVFGDYCSGTNHILPTNGAARYTAGLSVKDFIKVCTYQRSDRKSKALIAIASQLAEIEGLDAHRKAALARLG